MAEVVFTNSRMNRAQRRRIEKATDAADRVIQADRMFFDRHATRTYRLRLASASELEQVAAMYGKEAMAAPAGTRWVVAVKKVTRGSRIRRFLLATDASDLDRPDDFCRTLYEGAAGRDDVGAHLEAVLKAAASLKTAEGGA